MSTGEDRRTQKQAQAASTRSTASSRYEEGTPRSSAGLAYAESHAGHHTRRHGSPAAERAEAGSGAGQAND